MNHFTKNEIERIEFNSLTEMAKYIEDNEGKAASDCKGKSAVDESPYYKEFTKTNSMFEAIELSREGWSEGANLISKALEHVHALGKGFTFTPKNEVAGESVDIGRYLSGEPENMLEWELVETTGMKVVDIYLNVIASSNVPTNELINYGSVCL